MTLADIGISEQRKELAVQAIFAYLSQTPEGIELRQQGEKQQALEHSRERLERAVKGLKDK